MVFYLCKTSISDYMTKLLLKSVFFEKQLCDIQIEETIFSSIEPSASKADFDGEIVDCKGLAIFPAFYNAHCHVAMTLLRGYADDKPLFEWLQKHVWPMEAKLTEKDIEIGSRLAVLEMIKSGSVFFADMYYKREATMKVVEEMGIRATIGVTLSDALTSPKGIEQNIAFLKKHTGESERVSLAVMPHSIYTVSEAVFTESIAIAKAENYLIHTHLAETKKEVDDCYTQHHCSPVELMERYGALNSRLIAAHCVHFSEKDYTLFADAKATAVVNPCSNLKLHSGIPNITKLIRSGIHVALGTDGASSNNNLDMQEEMKVASLISKTNTTEAPLSSKEILTLATESGAKAYGLQAGKIKVGYLADCILLNMNNERMVPCHDITNNWIYSANSSAIDSVLCNGKFVMRSRHIDGEEDIVREANACVQDLLSR